MAKAEDSARRTAPKEAVREALSELRTTVLGPQILLGFQYEALFQPGFAKLEPWRQSLALAAFGLLIGTVALVIAPTSFHQLAARGEPTARQLAFSKRMLAASFCPFALAIGLNIVVVGAGELGSPAAIAAGLGGAGLAFLLWYGIELMMRRPAAPPAAAPRPAKMTLKDRITELMTETRIVLPGVQALLGFQLAAYLTEAFPKLESAPRIAHGLGLALLLVSMILLMTPAPFHRLAERGEDSERTRKVAVVCVLVALATLGLGVAADCYVAASIVTGSPEAALAAGVLAAVAGAVLWFAVPLLARRSGADERDQAALHRSQPAA